MRMRRFLISALIMALLIPVGLGRLSVMASAEELLGGIVHGNGWELDTATGELLICTQRGFATTLMSLRRRYC